MLKKKSFEKYRFILLIIFFICVFQLISGIMYSSTGKEYNRKNPVQKYEEVHIQKGDTLWEIAKKYKPNHQNIKQYVSSIKEFNHMKSDKLYAGEKIIIPIYKSIP
ncbi:cell division suppressor protein YneA [Defluviitalea saccharophila]|uniref:LysM peptidoglycan-binding domain-containing protein n=1 Tax=Defluviitalea saccharophila TaxID=879970 RepID=A0ABZ2Y6R0_9FIRM|nr:LysM peptidoglycan-binding domain-containing protein [Candidatus Epulonipiscium sp.]